MSTTDVIPVTERLSRLFEHLGIERVHLAAGGGLEPAFFAEASPHRIASMTYLCPSALTPGPLRMLSAQLLLIHGDRGPAASIVPSALPELPDARAIVLEDYVDALWSDPVADRRSEVGDAMLTFLGEAEQNDQIAPLDGADETGEVAGISYRARGSGPPLVLFPLDLAPSQWEPFIPELSRHYRTVTLGGAFLWVAGYIEQRMQAGYGSVARSIVETCAPQSGERVLDAGCGPGPVVRWLARSSPVAKPVVGIDINRQMLRQARELAAAEGIEDAVEFLEGNAEALPFPDESFDVTLAFTLLEEGDADRMLAELARVTRPGGRIGAMVRCTDMSGWDSLELPEAIRAKFGGPSTSAGAAGAGCADGSLYRRMRAAGLEDLKMGPQLGVFQADPRLECVLDRFEHSHLTALDDEEAKVWRAAAARAMNEGTYLWASPFHCAVGTKNSERS